MDNENKEFFSQAIEKLAQITERGMQEIRQDLVGVHSEISALRADVSTRLDRSEKSHDFRLTSLEREVADLRA